MLTIRELEQITKKVETKSLQILDPWDTEKGHNDNCLRVYKYNNFAIKCVYLEHDKNFEHSNRLSESYNILLNLNHPNISKVYGLYINKNIKIVVHKFGGRSLKDLKDLLSNEQKNRILQTVKNSIFYLWKNNISHLDLCPKNILLDNFLRVTIIDFLDSKIIVQPDKFEDCIDMREETIEVKSCCGIYTNKNFNYLKESLWIKQ